MRIGVAVSLLVVQFGSGIRRAKLTSKTDASCVRFLMAGDMGKKNSDQKAVANGMDQVAKSLNPDAIFALGDNIYETGAKDSSHMKSGWADIYLGKSSLKKKWYAVCGNHDWKKQGCGPERAFTTSSKNPSSLWQMPDYWHNKSFTAGGLTVDVFFIDTEIWRARAESGKRGEQRTWLNSKLSSSNADWKIIVGHVPMYSVGLHGTSSTLLDTLDPMMRKYKANIYITGHDHNQQHIQYQQMNYITSGSASKHIPGRYKKLPSGRVEKHFDDKVGFSTLEICDSSKATLKLYRASGPARYTATLMNEQPPGGGDGKPFTPSRRKRSDVTDEEDESMYVDEAVCGGVDLPVDLRCSDHKEDGCTVIPSKAVTCKDFCEEHGLTCVGAWSNLEEGCAKVTGEECSSYVSSEASQICQCAPA